MNVEAAWREGRLVLQGKLTLESWSRRHSPQFRSLWADLMFDALQLAPEAKRAMAVLQCEELPPGEDFAELLFDQLQSDWSRVRWQAMRVVSQHPGRFRSRLSEIAAVLLQIVQEDGSWMNRRQALQTLGALRGSKAGDAATELLSTPCSTALQIAASDPHWRVRDAVVAQLTEDQRQRSVFLESPPALPAHQWPPAGPAPELTRDSKESPLLEGSISSWREAGVREFLLGNQGRPPASVAETELREWDWDPSVLARKLNECPQGDARQWPRFIEQYVGHEDERVQRAALKHLEPRTDNVRTALQLLNDRRHPARGALQRWLSALDVATREEAMTAILHACQQAPVGVAELEWGLQQLAALAPGDCNDVQAAAAMLESMGGSLAAIQQLTAQAAELPDRVAVALMAILEQLPVHWLCELANWPQLAPWSSAANGQAEPRVHGFWKLIHAWLERLPPETCEAVFAAAGISSAAVAEAAVAHVGLFSRTGREPQSPWTTGLFSRTGREPQSPWTTGLFSRTGREPQSPWTTGLFSRTGREPQSPWQPSAAAATRALLKLADAGLVTLTAAHAAMGATVGSWKARQQWAAWQHNPRLDLLQVDACPAVRGAALRSESAQQCWSRPSSETSWQVLERAALLVKRPLWELGVESPRDAHPQRDEPSERPALPEATAGDPRWTWLSGAAGSEPWWVSRIGVSGHYGLPTRGFSVAVEAGVNLFFWEPGYTTMSQFCCAATSRAKQPLHFMAGTFKATGTGVKQDAQRALRSMKLERLSLFLLFWTRGWDRLTDDVIGALEELVAAGDLQHYSLSTHDRELALEAIAGHSPSPLRESRPWSPIMVRYSAAHRNAERRVLPAAQQAGVSVITFNNTCYGRLLRGGHVTAADCYRFALAHPAVAVSLSAPASMRELKENLEAFHAPSIDQERLEALRQHGAGVYAQDQRFDRCIRRR